MTTCPQFGVLVRTLAEQRHRQPEHLASSASVSEAELQAMLQGKMPPGPAFLRRLAPVLDVRAPDLFAMAQAGGGAVLMRMFENRNLGWAASAKVLFCVTGSCLPAATMGSVGHGRKELTPDLAAAFAAALGVSFDDFRAISGITPSVAFERTPRMANLAELVWELRRLDAEQVREVAQEA